MAHKRKIKAKVVKGEKTLKINKTFDEAIKLTLLAADKNIKKTSS